MNTVSRCCNGMGQAPYGCHGKWKRKPAPAALWLIPSYGVSNVKYVCITYVCLSHFSIHLWHSQVKCQVFLWLSWFSYLNIRKILINFVRRIFHPLSWMWPYYTKVELCCNNAVRVKLSLANNFFYIAKWRINRAYAYI